MYTLFKKNWLVYYQKMTLGWAVRQCSVRCSSLNFNNVLYRIKLLLSSNTYTSWYWTYIHNIVQKLKLNTFWTIVTHPSCFTTTQTVRVSTGLTIRRTGLRAVSAIIALVTSWIVFIWWKICKNRMMLLCFNNFII